jgi:hypothetical protein
VAHRLDFYFRQRVTEAELDLGFELLEQADRNLAADIGLFGVVGGAVPTQHAPVADLTVDLTGPGRAYDKLGQRIAFGTGQRVDLAIDSTGIPTEVSTSGEERWLGIFLKFARVMSDPRTDGNSQLVYFRRDESFQIVVRMGPQAPAGTAPKVALVDGELLLCDVRRKAGQTQIFEVDIDKSRRQAFVFATSAAVGVFAALWKAIAPSSTTAQAALDSVDALLDAHFTASGQRHKASDVDYAGKGFVAAKTVGGALDELVDDLSARTAGKPGASLVGADEVPGLPHGLPEGSVDGQLSQILGWLNAHEGAVTGAHHASAIAATPAGWLEGKSVQAELNEVAGKLSAKSGSSLIGSESISGSPHYLLEGTVRDQLVSVVDQLNAHTASGEHDARYTRRLGAMGAIFAPGETKQVLKLDVAPDHLQVTYYNLDAAGAPVQPERYQGPFTNSLERWVTKETDGLKVWVRNGSIAQLYVVVRAFG